MTKPFASQSDEMERAISFSEVAAGLYAYTADGDPNSGVIVGKDCVLVVDAQATPAMARRVREKIETVTDKPVGYVVLSHYHAVRILGARAYGTPQVIASQQCRDMLHERGAEDIKSEMARFPRLFRGLEGAPERVWPDISFTDRLSLDMGRQVELMHLGRAHTAGDIVTFVPDAGAMFTGDIVEDGSACYCGDAHFKDWMALLDRLADLRPEIIVPGRGAALVGEAEVQKAIRMTRQFLLDTFEPVARVAAAGGSLKEAFAACRARCDEKYAHFFIYEHCLPFNVSRAYDEALGIDHPRIWTAERDREMWDALQG